MRFADPLDGYAFQSRSDGHHPLWDTHDGGRTWENPMQHGLLAFTTGGGHAFALVGSCAHGVCRHLVLLRSPVKKDAWTALRVPLPAAAPAPSMTVRGKTVWITASVPKTTRTNQTLLISTDAGKKFDAEASPCTSALGGMLAASTPTVVWAVCPSGTQASLYRSIDGGRSWGQLKTPPLANSAVVTAFGRTSAIVATGATSQLLRTTDGGRKFSVVFTTSTAKGHWAFLGYTGRSTVSGLLASTMSGVPSAATSTAATSPGSAAGTGTTHPVTVRKAQLWHSKDAGATWTGPLRISS